MATNKIVRAADQFIAGRTMEDLLDQYRTWDLSSTDGLMVSHILAAIARRHDNESNPRPAARTAAGPKMPAVGSGKHVRCVTHEPVVRSAPGLRFLCFDSAPSRAVIEERIAWVEHLDTTWLAHHAAELARPIGDGLLEAWDGQPIRPFDLEAAFEARIAASHADPGIAAPVHPSFTIGRGGGDPRSMYRSQLRSQSDPTRQPEAAAA
jgi:hypothetical protein